MKNFEDLYSELETKVATGHARSRTVVEVEAGVHAIGKKIVEEAAEGWIAAEYESADRVASEISQLIYHLQAMMLAKRLTPTDIWSRL